MKYSFMLLTPCILLSHMNANAGAYERYDRPVRQQHMHKNGDKAERSFHEPVTSDEPRYLKLLQIIDQQQQIKSIKAGCTRQALFIPAVLKS